MSNFIFLLVIITLLKCTVQNPVPPVKQDPESMYEAVLEKCPNIAKTSIANHTEFKDCADWAQIQTTTVLYQETLPNVRCLLYYDSLVSFCTKAGELLTAMPRVVDDKNMKLPSNFSVVKICESANILFDKGEHELSNMVNANDCYELCLDIGQAGTSIDPYCAKAYYFVTFKVDDFKSTILEINQKSKNQDVTLTKQNSKDALNIEQSNNLNSNDAPKDIKDKPKSTLETKPEVANIETPNIPSNSKGAITHDNTLHEPNPAVSEPKKETEKANEEPKQELHAIMPAEEIPPSDVKKPSSPLPVIPPVGEQNVKIEETQPDQEQKPLVISKNQIVKEITEKNNVVVKNDKGADNVGEDMDTSIGEDAVEDYPDDSFKFNTGKASGVGSYMKAKPDALGDGVVMPPEDISDGDSSFFPYFLATMFLCIIGYVGYHNRHKLLALLLEGRQRGGRRHQRGGRRPNSANYHKLDSNLEEALSSSAKKSASNVIF